MRKRKWGSSRSSTDNKPVKRISNINISTDSLKGLIPDIKMSEPVLDLGNDDEKISDQEEDQRDVVKIRRTVVMKDQEEEAAEKKEKDEEEDGDGNVKMEEEPKEEDSGSSGEEEMTEERDTTQTEVTPVKEPKIIRRISQPVPLQETDEPIAPPRSPSPPRNPVSKVIHVGNLVRPFTIKQLKDLLSRTGTFDDSTFWIDKIKSHCYVTYETEEQAVQTRKALHNTKWPSSNPKILRLDFASLDEIEFHKQKELGPKAAVRRDSQQEMKEKREKEREKREKEAQKKREEAAKAPPIREWDRDKIRQSRERELSGRKPGRSRSPSPGRSRRGRERSRERERREKKVVPEKKVEDEPPAKLLDDLFKKTKTTPCIYWLPLTDAQVEQREKERIERIAMREKIRARESPGDNRSANRDRSSFDRRRPPSPYRRGSPPRRGGNEQDTFRDRSGPRRPDRGGPPRARSRSKSPRRRR